MIIDQGAYRNIFLSIQSHRVVIAYNEKRRKELSLPTPTLTRSRYVIRIMLSVVVRDLSDRLNPAHV